jgi:ubiquinone biosynthesis monooxygenase Coq7
MIPEGSLVVMGGMALAAGAEKAPAYPLLFHAIRMGCRVAIKLSERI